MLRDALIRFANEVPELRGDLLPLLRRDARDLGPGKPKKNDAYEMDPEAFLGRWLMSRKGTISQKAMEFWAKKYPYSGWAYRIGDELYDKPRGSWCKTTNGLIQWKLTMNPLGLTPANFHNYRGYISKGIDLAEMAKGEGKESGFRDTIIKVEEVTPLVRVTKIVDLDAI